MKLEGSLDAFSLPDIFQLLSFTKKSGVSACTRAREMASSTSPTASSPAQRRTVRVSPSRAVSSAPEWSTMSL